MRVVFRCIKRERDCFNHRFVQTVGGEHVRSVEGRIVGEGLEVADGGGEEAAASEAAEEAVDGWSEVARDEAGVGDDKKRGGDDDDHCY